MVESDYLIKARGSRDDVHSRLGANGFVSELCHMPPETVVQHHLVWGHVDACRCCSKSLMGSVLVRLGVRQHARRESVSKRAPLTTRTSLRICRINGYGRVAQPKTRIVIGIVRRPLLRVCDHLRASAHSKTLGVCRSFFRRGLGRAGACSTA